MTTQDIRDQNTIRQFLDIFRKALEAVVQEYYSVDAIYEINASFPNGKHTIYCPRPVYLTVIQPVSAE